MSNWQKVITLGFCTLFILVPLIWLPNTSELFEFNKIIVTYILTIIIVSSWIGRCIAEKKFVFRHTPLDIPILIFLLSTLISTLFSLDIHISIYGYYSRWNGGLLSLLSYTLLYWAFVSNMTRKRVVLSIQCSVFSAVIIAIYGGLEHFGWSPSCLFTRGSWGVDCWVQDVKNRVFATLGQPNWLAAYLIALIWVPMSALNSKFSSDKLRIPSGIEGEIRNSKQILNLLIFILLFTVLLFTKSRSGLLAFGVSAVVFWGLYFWKLEKLKNYLGFGIWGLIIATLIFSVGNPLRNLITRTQNPEPKTSQGPALEVGGTESGSIRKIVWTGATRIWKSSIKNLILGTGTETFAEAYYQFRPIEHNQTSEWELLYNKDHNEFLNYLATTGMLGLISYLVLLGFMAWIFFKTINDQRMTTNDNYMTVALLAGWVSILVTNFWGFSVVIVQLLLFLLPAMAITLKSESRRAEEYKLGQGQIFAILLFALTPALLLLYSIFRYFLADVKYATALNLIKIFQTTGQPQYVLSAYQQYTSAYTLNPAEPAISSELAVAAGYLANSLNQTDATSAGQLAQIALAASDKAIATSPHHPNYYKSRARTMILLSDIDTNYLSLAAEALAKPAQLSPTDPRIPFNLGIVENYMGATPSAILNFKKSLELKPDFADPAKQLQELSP